MQLSLFNDLITINDIINSNFDFFKNQNYLNYDNKNEIEKFLYDYNWQNPLYYHCNLVFNKITKDNKYKYIVINYDNDKVFIMFKVVQFIKVKKIKIIDKPFSLNKNVNNEKKIIEILLKKDFVNVIFKEKYKEFYKHYIFNESVQDFDYYIDFNIEYEKSFLPKYKHKKRINRYENNSDFKVEIVENVYDYNSFNELREKWSLVKKDVKKDNGFKNFINDKNFNKLFLNIYYKGKLIFNSCFIVEKDYLINVYQSSLSKYYRQNDENIYLKNSMSDIDDVANYYISKTFFNTYIKRSYIAGANPKHIDLVNFKENHSQGKIKYYKISGGQNENS